MEDLKSARDVAVNLLTIDMMAISIWLRLGTGIFGNLAGAQQTEAEKLAQVKRQNKRLKRLKPMEETQ